MAAVKAGTEETTLASLAVELQCFLDAKGYRISQDFSERFFSFAEASGHICEHDLAFYEPLFETLAVSSRTAHETFHDDYEQFVRNRRIAVVSDEKAAQMRLRNQAGKKAREQARESTERAEMLRRKLEKMRQAQGEDSGQIGTRKLAADTAKLLDELRPQFDSAFSDCPHKARFAELPDIASRKAAMPSAKDLSEMKRELKSAAKKAVKGRNAMTMMKLLDAMEKLLHEISKHEARNDKGALGQVRAELAEAQRAADEASARFEDIVRRMNAEALQISKDESAAHRREFEYPRNAVCSASEGAPELSRQFTALGKSEKQAIYDYIRENARKFKTRMTRNIRTGRKLGIDIAETCKKACGTMGVPIRLAYEKPTRNKARLLMFLDVSGSCKEASEMMLTFMHAMREAFPGGCRTYAFVNSLYDISAIFDSVDADQAISAVLSEIPTRGVYSDYHRPFSTYAAEHLHEVDRNTLVFFIGDARNNRNPTSEEDIKAIARKAKRAYWLNTEDRSKWDRADSIMGVYSQYMDRIAQVTTPGELIGFLTELK